MLPQHIARLEVGGCAYDVRINDCPVRRNPVARAVALEIPVNQWLKAGENVVAFTLSPPAGAAEISPGARCSVTIRVRDVPGTGEPRDIHRLVHDDGDKKLAADSPERGNVKREGGTLRAESSFTIDAPIPAWRWLSSRVFEDDPATIAALLGILRDLGAELAAARLDAAVARFAARDAEAARASDEPLAAVVGRTRNALEPLVGGAGFTLQPLPAPGADPQPVLALFGGGRLARLEMPDGKSPLRFVSADGATTAQLPVLFHRAGDAFEIIA